MNPLLAEVYVTKLGTIAPSVDAMRNELLRVLSDAGTTNMVDDCITNKRDQGDLPAYAATPSDLQRLAVFKAVAKAHWHTITLTRMFTPGTWSRAPVLLALTGLETLFAHLHVALVAAGAKLFADHKELYAGYAARPRRGSHARPVHGLPVSVR